MIPELRRFIRNSGVYAFGNVLNRTAAFVLLPLYTYYLTAGEYGILELLYSVSNIVSSFLGLGLAHAALRFYFEYEDPARRKSVIPTIIITSAAVSVPVIAVLCYLSPFISDKVFDGGHRAGVIITLVTVALELNRQIGLAYIRAREYAFLYVLVMLGQLLVQVGCNIYFVAVLKSGVDGILMGNMISIVFSLILLNIIALRECGVRMDLNIIRAVFNYSYPFLLTSITGVIFNNADRFLIKSFISAEALGLYALAVRFGQILQVLILESFQRAFGPFRFSIMKQENAGEIFSRITNYLSAVVFLCALGIIAFGPDVIRVMSPREYWGAGPMIPLIVLSIILQGFGYIFQTGILFQKSTKELFRINLISNAILVSLDFALIPFLGVHGALVALVAQALAATALTYTASQKLYHVRYDFRSIANVAAMTAAAYALVLLVPSGNLALSVAAKSALTVLFIAALFKSGLFNSSELGMVKSYIKKFSAPGGK